MLVFMFSNHCNVTAASDKIFTNGKDEKGRRSNRILNIFELLVNNMLKTKDKESFRLKKFMKTRSTIVREAFTHTLFFLGVFNRSCSCTCICVCVCACVNEQERAPTN